MNSGALLFYRWPRQGLLKQINRALNEFERLELERHTHLSLGIVDHIINLKCSKKVGKGILYIELYRYLWTKEV